MQAGLIKATPGPHGGLRLNEDPSDISMLMILEALEGPVHLIKQRHDQKERAQGSSDLSLSVWTELEQKIISHLSSQKLDKLIKM